MVFAVGLTGNIASGKSTAAAIFAGFGAQVFSADLISKELTAKHTFAYKKMIAHFGEQILLEDGELNRKSLRNIIFSQTQERIWLENLLHPLIRGRLEYLVNACTSSYCIVEIPLLPDRNHYPYLNAILVITAPKNLQIARIMERDFCTKEQALAILAAQPDPALYLKNADEIIVNTSDLEALENSLKTLHYKYLATVNI